MIFLMWGPYYWCIFQHGANQSLLIFSSFPCCEMPAVCRSPKFYFMFFLGDTWPWTNIPKFFSCFTFVLKSICPETTMTNCHCWFDMLGLPHVSLRIYILFKLTLHFVFHLSVYFSSWFTLFNFWLFCYPFLGLVPPFPSWYRWRL